MSTAVLDAPPDEELWLPPAFRQVRPQTGLSSTHPLAGGGGDTLGLFEAGFLPLYAGKHVPVCIESHIANWARLGTRHELADIATSRKAQDRTRNTPGAILLGFPTTRTSRDA